MTDKTRIALIGVGMVAQTHVDAISASPDLTLSGVCARRPENAEAFAKTNGGCPVFRSVEDIMPANTDFAIIATPPNARGPLITHFCEAGVPVLMEKPIERTLAAARGIVAQCEGANLPLGIIFQHRTRAAAQELKRLLPKLGRLALVDITVPWWRDQGYYDQPGRGTFAQDGGGVLITQAIHTLDLALSLAGPVWRVQSMARTTVLHEMEAEDIVSAGLEFMNGALGTLMATTASYPGDKERIVLHGEKGVAYLEGDKLTLHWRDGRSETVGEDADTGGGSDPMGFTHAWHQAVIENFAMALREGRLPLVTGRDGLNVHILIDALIRSSNEGRVVELSHV